MKLMLIVADQDKSREIEQLMESFSIGFTEIPRVLGEGVSGRKFGNRAFPGANNLYFTVVPLELCQELLEELRHLNTGDKPSIRVFTINTQEVV